MSTTKIHCAVLGTTLVLAAFVAEGCGLATDDPTSEADALSAAPLTGLVTSN